MLLEAFEDMEQVGFAALDKPCKQHWMLCVFIDVRANQFFIYIRHGKCLTHPLPDSFAGNRLLGTNDLGRHCGYGLHILRGQLQTTQFRCHRQHYVLKLQGVSRFTGIGQKQLVRGHR